MSNPNPEIYGAPETWINSKNFAGMTSAIAELIHAKRAQICGTWINPDQPTYDNYEKGSLQWGILGGKIIAQQPIDKSITAIGQGRDSAFHRLGVYANQQREGEVNPRIRSIGTATYDTNVLNFAAFDARCPTSSAVYANRAFNQRYNFKKSGEFVWYPDGAYHCGTNTMNGTFNISPFTYYESRTILLQIIVSVTDLTTAELEENPPTSPPATHTYNLETWKNDYSDHSITACFLNMRYLDSYNSTSGDMQYRLASYGGNTYQKAAFMCLDKLTIAEDGGRNTDIYHYGMYADDSNVARIVFFQSQSGLSKWDNSNELVALMPFDTAFGNTIKFGATQVWYQIPYSDEAYKAIMCATACFGCPFTPSKATTTNSNITINQSFTDADLCLPIILENGVADGDYTRGSDNADNPFIDLKSPYNYEYDPYTPTPIDPNTYSDTTNWNNVNFRQAFTKRYLLTGSQVAQLSTELWAAQSSKPADIDYNNFAIDEYLTNNPIDTIVSLKYFPCTFADTAPAIVHLGKYTTNIAATALGTSVRIIDFAPIECFPHFDDFRDYEPHTELAMYIPFCGTVKIPTAECMGNYVSVKLAIDTNTGAATGYIIVSKTGSGGICVATCQGMAAIDIPVSGLQSANLANAVFNATANWTQTQINNFSANSGLFRHMGGSMGAIARGMTNSIGLSDVKGGVLGGPIGAVGTLVNSLNPISALQRGLNIDLDNAKADYELSHIQVPTRLVGSASPALGCVIELDCRLIIYRPVTDETALSNYADTVGFATLQGGTVSQFSGFTVGTIDVSGINATAKEKQAIAAAFANGVYL